MSEPPLMRRLRIHNNIPVSDIKLMFGIWVGIISSHLTADKLFVANPRAFSDPPKMILLLDAKSIPAIIFKPLLFLVAHMDNLDWNMMSNQQQQMLIKFLNRIVSRPNVMSGQILYCTTNCILIDLMFKENFPTDISMVQPETSKWLLTERSDVSYLWVLQYQPTLGQEHQEVKCSLTFMGLVNN